MSALPWIEPALVSSRPRAISALLRYFGDLDRAEEAYQEACLRALKSWSLNGPPRDPTAWLIFAGRNSGVDHIRRTAREAPLPDEDLLSDLGDVEEDIVARLDQSHYRDDILRLLFVCASPHLPATQQIALALRIVSGLSVARIARAFLVSEVAMEQRITRAKARIAASGQGFEVPDAITRSERLAAVSAMIYLIFNEGYSAGMDRQGAATDFCHEAIRLVRLLLRLFPAEPEIMGLAAQCLLQQSRTDARFDADGGIILLEDQDRSRWNRAMIAEALALVDKALRHRTPGPYQLQAAIAALHARANTAADTDWREIALLYRVLERLQPSPVVTLNRAVAVSKTEGPAAALVLVDPLAEALDGYFYFHGVRGGLLMAANRPHDARTAFNRAIALAGTAAEAAHIRMHLDRLSLPAEV